MRSGHFIVRQTQYKVILSPNPTEKGAVDLLTPDGVRLRSTILGVAVVDPASGASALLAEVKQSRPQWISPNQVIYPDAFDDVKADIRYTVGPDQFEQDLILRQQIPPEIILAAGLDPETARVAVLTEFFDPPSTPAHPRNTPARKRANGDEDIVFGAMTIGQSHCQWASSSNGVFQTVGAGGLLPCRGRMAQRRDTQYRPGPRERTEEHDDLAANCAGRACHQRCQTGSTGCA